MSMSVIRSRGLLPLVTAETISALGSQMTFLALPWFVLVTTGSAGRMTVVLAVQLAPIAILGIPSGALISKLGARRTLIIGDAARAPLMAAIPLLHALDMLSFPLLLVLVAAIGCFLAPYFSAQRLILPELVGDDEQAVALGNAFLEGLPRLMGLLGPAAAGVLIAVLDAPSVLYVDAATFAVSAVVLTLFVPARPPLAPSDDAKGLFAGVRFLLRHRLLGPLAGCALVLNALGQMLVAALPVLAYEEFGGSSRVAGVFFGSFGAGAVVGMVVAMRMMPRVDPIRLAATSLVALTLPIWLLLADLPAWGVVGALFVSAIFGPLVNAPLLGVLTTRTPTGLRPKVMTALITFAMLAGPVGLLVAGPLLERFGPHAVFGVVAAGELAAALVFAAVALRHREAGPELALADPV